MADGKAVSLTSATADKMSRHDMLEWVNATVHGQYKKIEELCSGVAYCQMMELLFPNSIGTKKIKHNAKLEHEFLHNLKLFQAAFTKLKFDKSVPIDRLMKAKFQDNFEFLQWFKKFFDSHSAGKENMKVPAALAAAAQNGPKPIRRPPPKTATSKPDLLKTPKNGQQPEERSVSPSSLRVLQETQEQLSEQIESLTVERDAYYAKLTAIEAVLTDSLKNEKYLEWCNRALAIMYATDDENPLTADEVVEAFEQEAGIETADL